jgi:hypothetical protein
MIGPHAPAALAQSVLETGGRGVLSGIATIVVSINMAMGLRKTA